MSALTAAKNALRVTEPRQMVTSDKASSCTCCEALLSQVEQICLEADDLTPTEEWDMGRTWAANRILQRVRELRGTDDNRNHR